MIFNSAEACLFSNDNIFLVFWLKRITKQNFREDERKKKEHIYSKIL